ncbi:MAG: sulfotransferase [Acidobacteria bacterium]|nr:sulfotransferase [Acidobacteriota bacterium]
MTPHSKPNFLLIGAAKSATTSLASLLEQHPDAAISRPKEPHFFSYDHYYRFGFESYVRLFAHAKDERAIGDASTSYSRIRHHPGVIARIQAHLKDPKILYMVRHPLERMESAYVEHLRTPGSTLRSINDAITRMPMIVDSSRYWEVFDAYRTAFGEDRMKVLWFEDYTANPVAVFQDVCRFLGLDDTFVPDVNRQVANRREDALAHAAIVNKALPPVVDMVWDADLRRQVTDALREDNLKLLRYFGKRDDHWDGLFAD